MNLNVLIAFSIFSFGIGYVFGEAKSFGFWKFLIVFIFAFPLLTSGKDYYTIAVIFAFFSGVLVAYDVLNLDRFRAIAYELAKIGRFFKWQHKKQEEIHQQNSNQNHYSNEDVKQEQERRREEAKEQRKQEDKQKTKQEETTSKPKKYTSNTRTTEEILGLNENFTKDELTKAYKREANRTHPDKLVGKPQELIDLMTIEFIAVSEAYDKLLKRF